ncbi:DUF5914 domain-containing protein [Streptomyces sp. NPDC048111]|uniref:DUF5914 domain-containing protein n=1 Tax=Streptomyces sp. NPDC048111 TaxID=3365500 RepID=UPI00371A55AF
MVSRDPARRSRLPLGLRRGAVPWEHQRSTWRDAQPALIGAALRRAQARPSGNWYVAGASRDLTSTAPWGRTIAGREIVVWRDAQGVPVAGPGQCPHLGAPLKDSPVLCGTLVCHWHGLTLDGAATAGWEPVPVHDDGVLIWVRLDTTDGAQLPLPEPVLPSRPTLDRSLVSVYTTVGTCEPEDIVANRLDPWHGAWFHPYAFVDLTVVRAPRRDGADGAGSGADTGDAGGADDAFVVDVSFKVAGRVVVPVRATFTAPEPRTVVMHIVRGEGEGSVVETHATPLGTDARGRPRTAVVEAVIATSDRPGFRVAQLLGPLARPLVNHTAGRLWRDDLAYAERRWLLRSTGRFPG